MKEKIKSIYGLKSEYYIEILDEIKSNEVNFILLNFVVPDSNPGDMDIMINKYDKLLVEKILKKNKFNHYTNIG